MSISNRLSMCHTQHTELRRELYQDVPNSEMLHKCIGRVSGRSIQKLDVLWTCPRIRTGSCVIKTAVGVDIKDRQRLGAESIPGQQILSAKLRTAKKLDRRMVMFARFLLAVTRPLMHISRPGRTHGSLCYRYPIGSPAARWCV